MLKQMLAIGTIGMVNKGVREYKQERKQRINEVYYENLFDEAEKRLQTKKAEETKSVKEVKEQVKETKLSRTQLFMMNKAKQEAAQSKQETKQEVIDESKLNRTQLFMLNKAKQEAAQSKQEKPVNNIEEVKEQVKETKQEEQVKTETMNKTHEQKRTKQTKNKTKQEEQVKETKQEEDIDEIEMLVRLAYKFQKEDYDEDECYDDDDAIYYDEAEYFTDTTEYYQENICSKLDDEFDNIEENEGLNLEDIRKAMELNNQEQCNQ